jgi:hypothetical protein
LLNGASLALARVLPSINQIGEKLISEKEKQARSGDE